MRAGNRRSEGVGYKGMGSRGETNEVRGELTRGE